MKLLRAEAILPSFVVGPVELSAFFLIGCDLCFGGHDFSLVIEFLLAAFAEAMAAKHFQFTGWGRAMGKKLGGKWLKRRGVPTVRDWRMPADSVVENHDYGASDQDIAEWYGLPLEDVRTILAYAEQHRRSAHLVR